MGKTDNSPDNVIPPKPTPGEKELINELLDHDETLRPKDASTKDLKELFTDEISQLVEQMRELTGTGLNAETFSPEIERTVARLLDHVSNTVLLDPM